MGKVHKTLKPNFDDHITGVPRDSGTWREGYIGSGEGIPNEVPAEIEVSNCCKYKMIPPDWEMADKAGSLWRAYACYICKKCGNACEPILIPKSASIKTAIQELKDLFCNSFKRK